MTKEELKTYLQNMQLDPELWNSLTALIDRADVVDQKLLDAIADVLDLQADFYEKTAAILEQQTVNGAPASIPVDTQMKTETQQQQQQVIDQLQQLTATPSVNESALQPEQPTPEAPVAATPTTPSLPTA